MLMARVLSFRKAGGTGGLKRLCCSLILLCYGRPFSTALYGSTYKRVQRLTDPLTCRPWWKVGPTSYAFSRALSISGTGGEQPLQEWEVDTSELAELLQKDNVYLIDVREPYELEEMGVLAPKAVNVPLDEVEDALQMTEKEFQVRYQSSLPVKDCSLIFYCMSGVRSLVALDSALDLGYSRARHYIRGWIGWQEYLEEQTQ